VSLSAIATWRLVSHLRDHEPKLFTDLGKPGITSGISAQVRLLLLVWGLDERAIAPRVQQLCWLLRISHVLLAGTMLMGVVMLFASTL
jgi:hypothetical protein